MKLDRLLGILTILLKNDRVTAPQLAEKFALLCFEVFTVNLGFTTFLLFVWKDEPLWD